MRRFCERTLGVALLASGLLLSGCFTHEGEPPEHFPRPLYDDGCPVISGSYGLSLDAGSQGALSEAWLGSPPIKASVLTIEDDPAQTQWRMGWFRDPVDFERELDAWRHSEPVRYTAWLREARLLLDPLSVRYQADRETAMRELGKLGPTPELRGHGYKWRCEDGWYVESQGDKAVRLTSDVDNGLLIRLDDETRSEISVWCGDGCAGIPYSVHVRSRWMRLSPVARPSTWYPPDVPFAMDDPGVTHYEGRDARVVALRERLLAELAGEFQLINLEQWSGRVVLSVFVDGMERVAILSDWLRRQPGVVGLTQSSRMAMSDGRQRIVLEFSFER